MFKIFDNHFINHDSGDLRKPNILAMSLTNSNFDGLPMKNFLIPSMNHEHAQPGPYRLMIYKILFPGFDS